VVVVVVVGIEDELGVVDLTHLGKGKLNPPDFTLVSETVLSGELQRCQHQSMM
jgi:hypothetical protein